MLLGIRTYESRGDILLRLPEDSGTYLDQLHEQDI